MSTGQYGQLASEEIRLDSPPQKARSIASSDSDEEYRDHLEDEPFGEKDQRFQDEGRMEDGEVDGDGDGQGFPVEPRRLRPRKKSRKVLAVLIGILVVAGLVGILAASSYSAPSYGVKNGNRHLTMDHIFNGTFAAKSKNLDWVKEADDGTYSFINSEKNVMLSTVSSMNTSQLLVNSSLVLDETGNPLQWQRWALSPDRKFILFSTSMVKQWRHSTFGNYYVHRLSDSSTFPITPPSNPPKVTKAIWSPVGHSLSFVKENDLFVTPGNEFDSRSGNPKAVRVTEDGSGVVFNGVPDWVYEEEVITGDGAMWWSPNGETLAYLRSDETAVKDYKLQYYNPSNDAFEVYQYPTELDMKYPKPGTPNPLVSAHTFSLSTYQSSQSLTLSKARLSWMGEMPLSSRIIMNVGWVGDDALLVKEVDRAARKGNVVLFQGGKSDGAIVRKLGKDGEEGDNGWIEIGQDVIPLKGAMEGYFDIVPKDGYQHIALYSPLNSSEPIWLTEGDWEVTKLASVDEKRGVVYFIAASPSIDRHLYAATLPTSVTAQYVQDIKAMTDTTQPGYFDVQFSPGSQYYVLRYQGPEVPWQRLMEVGENGLDVLMEGNGQLNQTLSEFMRPLVTRTTIESDGYTLNMLEILPPGIDTSGRKKYPVLMRVYGGPGSQMVSNRFDKDWHHYLACEKKYIIVIVDGRGTGLRGRQLRNPVVDDLGHWEVVDQIAGAREMIQRRYVDRSRIGIWGWSYGGYMTAKTIEAKSGIFTLGMAVAPVTNWLFYDSVYTERYMSTPTSNPDGYIRSAVNNVTAFDGVDFLLAHGSGDDNVHYANSASLLDKFTQQHVRGWRFRMFTDSDHSISKRDGYRELFEWMTGYLDEKWGKGGTKHHG